MNIVGIDSVIYGVEDLDRCIDFWNDFGLAEREANGDGAVFGTVDGASVVVRKIDDAALPSSPDASSTMRQVILVLPH